MECHEDLQLIRRDTTVVEIDETCLLLRIYKLVRFPFVGRKSQSRGQACDAYLTFVRGRRPIFCAEGPHLGHRDPGLALSVHMVPRVGSVGIRLVLVRQGNYARARLS